MTGVAPGVRTHSEEWLDEVLCPSCLRVCRVAEGHEDGQTWRIAVCSDPQCGYELNDTDGVVTVRQMLDGAETGSTWNDVDLPAWTRRIAQLACGTRAPDPGAAS